MIKKKVAKDGISDLINTIPTTLITQHKKIKQIIIIDNIKHNETTYISTINIEEKKNDITESSVKIINKENGEEIKDISRKFDIETGKGYYITGKYDYVDAIYTIDNETFCLCTKDLHDVFGLFGGVGLSQQFKFNFSNKNIF